MYTHATCIQCMYKYSTILAECLHIYKFFVLQICDNPSPPVGICLQPSCGAPCLRFPLVEGSRYNHNTHSYHTYRYQNHTQRRHTETCHGKSLSTASGVSLLFFLDSEHEKAYSYYIFNGCVSHVAQAVLDICGGPIPTTE